MTMTPDEAVFKFGAMLTQLDEPYTVSAGHDAARMASLCAEFCEEHNIPESDWASAHKQGEPQCET